MQLPDSVAADVLRQLWCRVAAPERKTLGVSRDTWRVDGTFWLSRSDATEEAAFRRETELLGALSTAIARRGATWQVPEVVPTAGGDSIAVSEDGVWRLTRDVPGEQPDMREPATYPALARRLAELHAVLETVHAPCRCASVALSSAHGSWSRRMAGRRSIR